jgi:hypothetical protein
MKANLYSMSRQRYIAVTVAAGLIGVLSAIFLIGAPPVPAVAGVGLAVGWLIWRAPSE